MVELEQLVSLQVYNVLVNLNNLNYKIELKITEEI